MSDVRKKLIHIVMLEAYEEGIEEGKKLWRAEYEEERMKRKRAVKSARRYLHRALRAEQRIDLLKSDMPSHNPKPNIYVKGE